MKKKIIIITFLIFTMILSACSDKTPSKEEPSGDKGESAKPIVEVKEPEVLEYESKENGQKLYEWKVDETFLKNMKDYSYQTASHLLQQDGNTVFSPVSLHLAFSIATEGAAEGTQAQMLDLLRQPDIETLQKGNKEFLEALTINNEIGQLIPTNALWVGEKTRRGEVVELNENFAKNIATEYAAGIFQVDFHDPKTKEVLEKWVEDQTHGMIKPELYIDKDQVLSIFNTIYFKDQWRNSFDKENTREGDFTTGGKEKVKVPYMKGQIQGTFKDSDKYTKISLPLKNAGSMIFVKPKEGIEVKALADEKILKDIFETEGDSASIELMLPKFQVKNHLDLIPMMKELGVVDAFDDRADFSNLINIDSMISAINQDNAVDVNEEGVSAASFTEISLIEKVSMPEIKEFTLDRSFLFIIKDHMGNMLFIGAIDDPTVK